jgi:hypothetical protein
MVLTLRTELHQAARACGCKDARVMAQSTAQIFSRSVPLLIRDTCASWLVGWTVPRFPQTLHDAWLEILTVHKLSWFSVYSDLPENEASGSCA